MANIAELWVVIGTKLEGFNQGMSDAEKAMVKVSQKFADIGKAMTVVGAAITGAFAAIVYKTVDMGDKFWDLAQQTGISVEILSSLKLAADKSGTSIEAVARGMKFLAEEMIKTSTATDKSKTILGALGISATDANGKLRNMNDVLFDVADKFAGMKDGAVKTRLAVELFGRGAMELIPILNLDRKGLEENAEAVKRLGTGFTTEGAKAADKLKDAFIQLTAAGAGLGKTIAEQLMPTVKKVVDSMTEAIAKVRAWAAAHPELTKFLSATALAIGGLTTGMGSALIAIGGLMKFIPTLSVVFAALSGPIGIVIAALAGLIAIGILVYKNWDEIKEKLIAIWAYIKAVAIAVWKTIWDTVGPIISVIVKGIVTAFTVLWNALKNIAVAIANVVIGPFNWLKEKAVDIFKSVAEFVIDKLIWLMEQIAKIPIIKKFVQNLEEGLAAAKASLAESSAKMKESSEKMAEGFDKAAAGTDKLGKSSKVLDKDLKAILDSLDKTKEPIKTVIEQLAELAKTTEVTRPAIAKLEAAFWKVADSGKVLKSDLQPIAERLIELKIQAGEKASPALILFASKLRETLEPTKNLQMKIEEITLAIEKFGDKADPEALRKLKDALEELQTPFNFLKKQLGVVFTSDDKKRINDVKLAIEKFGEKANPESLRALKKTLEELQNPLGFLKKELGLTFTAEIQRRIDDINKVLGQSKDNLLPPSEIKRLRDELDKLQASLSDDAIAASNLGVALKTDLKRAFDLAVESFRALRAAGQLTKETTKAAIQGIIDKAKELGIKFRDLPEDVRKAARKISLSFTEVSTIVSDAMRTISRSIVDALNLKELLGAAPKTIEFDSSYYDAMVTAAETAYDKIRTLIEANTDATIDASRRAYDAQELRYSRAEEDEDIRYRRKYDRQRRAIENSTMTEEEKNAALLALEIAYEDAKLARDRAREDAKLIREETHEANLERIRAEGLQELLELQNAHQLELDKIREAEELARQKQADDEEKRQGSLWFKVKGIFATAIEEMATIWLTKFITPILTSITEKLFPAFKSVGKSGTDAAAEIGTAMKGAAAATVTAFLAAFAMIAAAFGAFYALVMALSTMKKLTAAERAEFDRAYEAMMAKAGIIVAPSLPRKRTAEETEPGYQLGGIAWRPQLARVAEVEPEIIMPYRKYLGERQAVAGHGGTGSINYNLTYAPQISAMDSQDVYRFMAGKGREALEKIIKENVRGITRIISAETGRY